MKNKNLINLLMQENPDAEVILTYDSMCGQYDNFIMARDRRNGDIYLACEDAETIDLDSNDWLELIPMELNCTDSIVDENKRLRAVHVNMVRPQSTVVAEPTTGVILTGGST